MEYGVPIEIETPRGLLVFNDYGNPNGYLRATGFEIPVGMRTSVEDLPARDGSVVGDSYRRGATPILRGEIASAWDVRRSTLIDEIRGKCRSIDRADGILRWTPSGKTSREMIVRLLEDVQIAGGGKKTFQIALVSEDSYAYSSVLKSLDSNPLDAGSSSGTWSLEGWSLEGWSLGTGGASGVVTATNEGDAPSFPLVQIHGPISDPIVWHDTTGEYVSLPAVSIAAGNFVEVDMRAEAVYMNGDPDFPIPFDAAVSTFFALLPDPEAEAGANLLRLSGADYDSTTRLRVIFRDAFA